MARASAGKDAFAVTGWVYHLGGFLARHPSLCIRLGNWETRAVADAIADQPIERPVYIAGLARSGSTILLETLARHAWVATHRYRDYPPIFTPYLWNRWLDRLPQKAEVPAERTHKDGIAVTSESPEAFEEALWMAFFPGIHDPHSSAVLDGSVSAPAFEAFYRDHIRKLLAVRRRRRYVAKGNYNVTRLGYLARLFPDARFIVPVRDPVWHIASLIKQQTLFSEGQRASPRALRHLQRVGHFEFGLDRRPVNVGDTEAVSEIAALWAGGEEVRGWARYWAMIHDYLAGALAADPALAEQCMVVRYEDLCGAPARVIARVMEHCALPAADTLVDTAAKRIRFPSYYRPAFSDQDMDVIMRETSVAAARFGYDLRGTRAGAG